MSIFNSYLFSTYQTCRGRKFRGLDKVLALPLTTYVSHTAFLDLTLHICKMRIFENTASVFLSPFPNTL